MTSPTHSAVGLYERVTYRPEGGRARTVILHRPTVSTSPVLGEYLAGVECDTEGDKVSGRGHDARRHLISTALVVRRVSLAMDNHTGLLTEV